MRMAKIDKYTCKDCKERPARVPYSVCEECYQRRIRKFLKSGGFYIAK